VECSNRDVDEPVAGVTILAGYIASDRSRGSDGGQR
jgi:hypothetical protein